MPPPSPSSTGVHIKVVPCRPPERVAHVLHRLPLLGRTAGRIRIALISLCEHARPVGDRDGDSSCSSWDGVTSRPRPAWRDARVAVAAWPGRDCEGTKSIPFPCLLRQAGPLVTTALDVPGPGFTPKICE